MQSVSFLWCVSYVLLHARECTNKRLVVGLQGDHLAGWQLAARAEAILYSSILSMLSAAKMSSLALEDARVCVCVVSKFRMMGRRCACRLGS